MIERSLAIFDPRVREMQHEFDNRRNLLRVTLQFRNPANIGIQISPIGPLKVGTASIELHDLLQ